ncbi:MAG: lysine 2,3-aminomutase [Myxococcota bacterium]|jgi:lysine 2,3-aminomutase|nr:lysine 2,3-aminomutase [Myxococcota bacterium]
MSSLTADQQALARKLSSLDEPQGWRDWRWQQRHTIRDPLVFERLLGIELAPDERERIGQTAEIFPLAVTPYYLSLIDPADYLNDPVYRQCFPSALELNVTSHEMVDPLAEDEDCPVPGITLRYPDRVLFHVSNRCAVYCRHCTRKRKVGDPDHVPDRADIVKGIEYIRATPRVRDVLLSGGDPLLLSDAFLDWILTELRGIPHVEVIRIGTRLPVVLPYRITDELVAVLRRHHPLWLNTHFNHPRELTRSARAALAKLADAGIPLGNQSVLLAGVNDCPRIMKALVQQLVRNRVRPYYIYQCDLSQGLEHFRTPVGKGIEIMENLIGHTSGFAVPTFVVDAPGGGGKIPVSPNYIVSWSANKVVLRNYEGVLTTYKEPDAYCPRFCHRDCDQCDLQLVLDSSTEDRAVGVSRLLSDHDTAISLVPDDNERMGRRD